MSPHEGYVVGDRTETARAVGPVEPTSAARGATCPPKRLAMVGWLLVPSGGMERSRRKRPTHCKRCTKPPKRGEVISWRGHCIDCAVEVCSGFNAAQSDPTTPEYERTQRAAVAGLLRYAERLTSA